LFLPPNRSYIAEVLSDRNLFAGEILGGMSDEIFGVTAEKDWKKMAGTTRLELATSAVTVSGL
jgi:hypothetical protein